MTVETVSCKVVAQGNGATTTFNYGFLIPDATQCELIYTDPTGDSTVQNPANYTLTGIGDDEGGTFTFSLGGTPIPNGSTVTLLRLVPYTQETDFGSQGAYIPSVLDNALDTIVLEIQQLLENITRAIVFPPNEVSQPVLPSFELRAGNLLGFDINGQVVMIPPPTEEGGGGVIVPASAPLLGSNSGATLVSVAIGANLVLSSGTLSATTTGSLPDNANLLGTNAGGTATAVTVAGGLVLSAGTLSAVQPPASAQLLGSSSASSFTAVVAGTGLSLSNGTLTSTAAVVPLSAPLLSSNPGGTIQALNVGSQLSIGNGALNVTGPLSATLVGTNSTGTFTTVTLGARLSYSNGTLSASGGTYTAGTNITINNNTLSVNTPASAPLLSTGSGGTFTSTAVGSGLTLAGGTLSANAQITYVGGQDISIAGSTVSLAAPNAQLLGGSSAGSLASIAVGSNLTLSGGTLSASGGGGSTPPASAALLATNSGSTFTAVTLGYDLAISSGTLNLAAPNANLLGGSSAGSLTSVAAGKNLTLASGTLSVTPPASAALLASNSGQTITAITLGYDLAISSGTLNVSAPNASLLGGSSAGSLSSVSVGSGLTLSGGTLSAGGGSGTIEVTDGTHTLTAISELVISGGTISGSNPTGTLTVSSGGGGGPSIAPGIGTFWTGSAWNRPAGSSMTWINQAGASYNDVSGGPLQIYGGTAGGWHFLSESVSGTFTHTFLFSANGRPAGGDSIGVMIGNTSSNNFMPMYIYFNQSPPTVYVDHWGGLSGGGSYISHPASFNLITNGPPYCFRIQNDGTNLTFWYSSDPVNDNAFTLIYTETLATFITSVNVIGFGYYNNDTTSQHTSIALYGLT
jgi:hypothetical protein